MAYPFIVILLLFLVPVALYIVRPRTFGRRRFGISFFLTAMFITVFGLFVGIYKTVNPLAHLMLLFSVIGIIVFLAKRHA